MGWGASILAIVGSQYEKRRQGKRSQELEANKRLKEANEEIIRRRIERLRLK